MCHRRLSNSLRSSLSVPNVYASLDEMLEADEYDVAVICVWGAFHAQVGTQLAASRRVRAILCEKPFTAERGGGRGAGGGRRASMTF